jgi:hypothetical protein
MILQRRQSDQSIKINDLKDLEQSNVTLFPRTENHSQNPDRTHELGRAAKFT